MDYAFEELNFMRDSNRSFREFVSIFEIARQKCVACGLSIRQYANAGVPVTGRCGTASCEFKVKGKQTPANPSDR